jgi:hypothetical protein
MNADNDPYWAGRESERPIAEWFRDLHARRVGNRRLHIRGIFYIAVGEDPDPEGNQEPERWPPEYFDGAFIDKTDMEHWTAFHVASKRARNAGLVHPELITDTKTRVDEYFVSPGSVRPFVYWDDPELDLPDLFTPMVSRFTPAQVSTHGYRNLDLVPSLVEVWIEKELDSPDQPIIRNVCSELGVNVVTGSGNMLVSQAYQALRRQRDAGLPLRILFLSDFDDAGDHMAVSPARHIQFALQDRDPKADVRVLHLALTEEQVREQNIPASPPTSAAQEKKARLRYFSERTGSLGSAQLNALTDTGRRAEWFEMLLRDAIWSLRDIDLVDKAREAAREANEIVAAEVLGLMRWPHRALELLSQRYDETKRSGFEDERRAIQEKLEQINELERQLGRLEADLRRKKAPELNPLRERGEAILELAHDRLQRLDDLELPVYEAEEPEGAADGWLFDSRRGVTKQARWYNNRKFGVPVDPDYDELGEDVIPEDGAFGVVELEDGEEYDPW